MFNFRESFSKTNFYFNYPPGEFMKHFVITSLLCVTLAKAEYKPWEITETKPFTKETTNLNELQNANFEQNLANKKHNLKLTYIDSLEKKQQIIIDKNHIPNRGSFPRGTLVYFPLPKQDYLQNKDAINFETNGSYIRGYYQFPDIQSKRIYWSIVKDIHGNKFTVPTVHLMLLKSEICFLEHAGRIARK